MDDPSILELKSQKITVLIFALKYYNDRKAAFNRNMLYHYMSKKKSYMDNQGELEKLVIERYLKKVPSKKNILNHLEDLTKDGFFDKEINKETKREDILIFCPTEKGKMFYKKITDLIYQKKDYDAFSTEATKKNEPDINTNEFTYDKYNKSWSNNLLFEFVIQTLEKRYRKNLLKYNNEVFPCIHFPAPREQRVSLESPLNKLDLDERMEISDNYKKDGEEYIDFLKKNKARLWEGEAYCLKKIKYSPQLSIESGYGKFFNILRSCDLILFELIKRFITEKPNEKDYSQFIAKLKHRTDILKNDPFSNFKDRCVGIGISTSIFFKQGDRWKTILKKRSPNVAHYPGLIHVAPSCVFESMIGDLKNEYCIKHQIHRELLEELLNYEEISKNNGCIRFDQFYNDPNLMYLNKLESLGFLKYYFTGIAFDLFTLKAEICTAMLITDPNWFENQSLGNEVNDLRLKKIKMNWEFSNDQEIDVLKSGPLLDLGSDLTIPEDIFKPTKFVPTGAA